MRVLPIALLAAATLSHAQAPDACPPVLPQPLSLAAAESRMESCNGKGLKSADVALEYQFQRSTSINRIKIFKSWTIPD